MRKNTPRKWLHAILDLLPILIIPIFAININQKSVEPISIEVQEKISVNFNQKIQNGDFLENTNRWIIYSGTGQVENQVLYLQNAIGRNGIRYTRDTEVINGHKYLFSITYWGNNSNWSINLYDYAYGYFNLPSSNTNQTVQYINICEFRENVQTCYINFDLFPSNVGVQDSIYVSSCEVFDLTQMFGEGNEPTINEFNALFPNSYYEYTESQKMLVDKPTPTTYDDTDIGSQFLYSLYKPINDYFNFNNLFNMNDVWNWIQLNLFQGTAPLPVFMVWNIIVYEFFMDLIFLLYSVFMFVIDFATNCIDRFTRRANGC